MKVTSPATDIAGPPDAPRHESLKPDLVWLDSPVKAPSEMSPYSVANRSPPAMLAISTGIILIQFICGSDRISAGQRINLPKLANGTPKDPIRFIGVWSTPVTGNREPWTSFVSTDRTFTAFRPRLITIQDFHITGKLMVACPLLPTQATSWSWFLPERPAGKSSAERKFVDLEDSARTRFRYFP